MRPIPTVELECEGAPIAGGAAYASIIEQGQAEILTDPAEKIHGLACLMATQTGRIFAITPAMAETVAVIRVHLEAFTAKSRPLPDRA